MRNWSIFTVKVNGLEVRIHFTFLALLVFLLLTETNRSGARVIPRTFVLTGLVLLAILLHELGHAWASARKGFPIKAMILLPIAGLAMADPTVQGDSARNLRRETFIALAGPLVSVTLAGATALSFLALGLPLYSLWLPPLVTVAHMGISFFWVNAALCVFNLLPAYPLDGGKILRAWLAQRVAYA